MRTKQGVITPPRCPLWLLSRVEEKPLLYLGFKSTDIITTNGVIVHQEIGVRFVLRHQMANPIWTIAGFCPNVGRGRRSKGMILVRSRVKIRVAFEISQ